MPSHAQSALAHLLLAHDHASRANDSDLTAEIAAGGVIVVAALNLFASFAKPAPAPSAPPEAMMQLLMEIHQKVISMDQNLDNIANDWAQLKPAITTRLNADADTIAKLTAELAAAATSSTPLSDERAAQIHQEMQATIASLNGVATAVGNAGGPAPDPTSTGATGAVGTTAESTGATGTTGATGATTSGDASTPPSGSTGSAGPATPPPGAL